MCLADDYKSMIKNNKVIYLIVSYRHNLHIYLKSTFSNRPVKTEAQHWEYLQCDSADKDKLTIT